MRKIFPVLISLALLFGFSVQASAQEKSILLASCYRQQGWGQNFELGAMDDEGCLWTLELKNQEDIPYRENEFWAWMEQNPDLVCEGRIDSDTLSDICSLVMTVENQKTICESVACDAGSQTSYACRKNADGSTEIIVLGYSGDEHGENTDPAAQALYRFCRMNFKNVTDYDGDELIAPCGFTPVPLTDFCGFGDVDLKRCTLTAYENDCEAGSTEITPVFTVQEIANMTVTGKKNSASVTGGTVSYYFTDEKGNIVAYFEFYRDYLVTRDGMYFVK